jgi:hypothetical protein
MAFPTIKNDTITIGANVQFSGNLGFAGFVDFYRAQGRKAGTYTYNSGTRSWSVQFR